MHQGPSDPDLSVVQLMKHNRVPFKSICVSSCWDTTPWNIERSGLCELYESDLHRVLAGQAKLPGTQYSKEPNSAGGRFAFIVLLAWKLTVHLTIAHHH